MLVAEVNVMEAERYLSGEQETRLEAEASAGADRHRTGPGPERGGGGVTGLCDRLAVIRSRRRGIYLVSRKRGWKRKRQQARIGTGPALAPNAGVAASPGCATGSP